MDNGGSILVRSDVIKVGEISQELNINLEIPVNTGVNNLLIGIVQYICPDYFVSGAIINIMDLNGNVIMNTITDKNGEYCFYNLEKGWYMILLNYNDQDICYDYVQIEDKLINNYDFYNY